ncbi:MAG: type I phosphomannose isomerase catalytic subunit [Bacteroidota bacterium]|nr:type I phosphomannose isomerase catalytic subunit [Bacteroidota bacterium]
MNTLYPVKFKSIYKEKIWGGNKLNSLLSKPIPTDKKIGESWEISAVKDNISVISNGELAENTLQDIIEIYMGDIVGDKIYEKYGIEFPLLIKFIDASDILSVQVHPDDKLAKKRHQAYGKTEMWYIIDAEKDSKIITGFNKEVNKTEYSDAVNNGKLKNLLNFENTKAGDSFFIPAGRIHAIGSGVVLAEIQQTSDITYRIYDWDRKDKNGKTRELHNNLALDAIDYNFYGNKKDSIETEINKSQNIVSDSHFSTNIFEFDKVTEMDYFDKDSFVIYMCLDGDFDIHYSENDKEMVNIKKGETVLIPAVFENIILKPKEKSKILEIFID